MEQYSTENLKLSPHNRPILSGTTRKHIRVIMKVRIACGVCKFISLDYVGNRYVWDKREGYHFLEWWDGKNRRRERAGLTPNEALEALRRKQHELVGELIAAGKAPPLWKSLPALWPHRAQTRCKKSLTQEIRG